MKICFNDPVGRQCPHALLKYSTPAKLLNLARSLLQRKLRRSNVAAYPFKLVVDITNSCNLRCTHCPTGKQVKGRPRGFMDLEKFGQILDQLGGHASIIDLFNWGEFCQSTDCPPANRRPAGVQPSGPEGQIYPEDQVLYILTPD